MIDWTALTVILNGLALLTMTALVGAGIFGMVRRVILFQRAETPVPVILRRDLGLFAGLAVIGLESLLMRALGISLTEADPVWRFLFTAHWDAILIIALLYWSKVELWDVDDPEKP